MPPKKRPAEAPSPVSGLSMGFGTLRFSSQDSSQGSVVVGSQGSIMASDVKSQDGSQSQPCSQPEYFSGDFCTPEDQVAELGWSQEQREAENAEPNSTDKMCPPTPDSAAKRRKTRSAAPVRANARVKNSFMYELDPVGEEDSSQDEVHPKPKQASPAAGKKNPPAPPAKGRGAKGRRGDAPAQTNTFLTSWLSQERQHAPSELSASPMRGVEASADISRSPTVGGGLFAHESRRDGGDRAASGGTTVGAKACFRNPFLAGPLTDKERKTPSRAVPRLQKGARVSRYLHDFEELAKLGEGNFGSVMLVRSRVDGQKYAVKRKQGFDCDKALSKQGEKAMREVWAMAALTTVPNVVRYHGAWSEDGQLFIQMEACECHIKSRYMGKHPSAAVLLRILKQVGAALAGMHSMGLGHLDVKPENIYCAGEDFRLGDFGLVCSQQMVWDGVEPEEGDGRYASPQVIQGFSQLEVKALAPCDVYALGASVFELALGKSLTGRDPQYLQVREGAPVELADTSTLGKALASILTEMMHPSAEDRIDCATAVKLARDALAAARGLGAGGGSGLSQRSLSQRSCSSVSSRGGDVEMAAGMESGAPGPSGDASGGDAQSLLSAEVALLREQLAAERRKTDVLERQLEHHRSNEAMNVSGGCGSGSQRSDAEPVGSQEHSYQESPVRCLAQPMPAESPNPPLVLTRRSPRGAGGGIKGFAGWSPASAKPSPAPKGASFGSSPAPQGASPMPPPPPRPPVGLAVKVTRAVLPH